MSGCARRRLEATCRGGRFLRRVAAPVLSIGAVLLAPWAPGECQMRLMMLSLLIGCMALAFAGNARREILDVGQVSRRAKSRRPGMCRRCAEPRRLVLHIRPVRAAAVAAHPAFLDAGARYSWRRQVGHR